VYVIVNWSGFDFADAALVTNEDGSPRLFETLAEACTYGQECLNFSWQPLELNERRKNVINGSRRRKPGHPG
jgi:hypothetical protein